MRGMGPTMAAGVLLAGLLAGCAGAPDPDPVPVARTLRIAAGPGINDYNGGANPVVLRLYQLSERTAFEQAPFWEIFNGGGSLAGVVLAVQSVGPIYPGEDLLVPFDLRPEARYLGVFAEFADFERQEYRAVTAVEPAADLPAVAVSVTASGVGIGAGQDPADAGPPPRRGFFARLFGDEE